MRSIFETSDQEQKDNDSLKDNVVDLNKDKATRVFAWRHKNIASRIKSEIELEQELPWHFEKGASYHIFSYGNVDTMTFLRVALKQQPLEYLALSAMAIAATDVESLVSWYDKGLIGKLDLYVSRLYFRTRYDLYSQCCDLARRAGGRVAVFQNHAKVFAGFGERFDFVVESSANPNKNERCEQTSLSIDTGLARFYKSVFDEIISFQKDFEDWKPYQLKRDLQDDQTV